LFDCHLRIIKLVKKEPNFKLGFFLLCVKLFQIYSKKDFILPKKEFDSG
jgi:hypothetical protein